MSSSKCGQVFFETGRISFRPAMLFPDAAQIAAMKDAAIILHPLVIDDIGDGLQEPFGIEHDKLIGIDFRAL